MRQAKKFLSKKYEVRIKVRFRGREKRTMLEAAHSRLDVFVDLGKVKHPARMVGNMLTMTIIA